MVKVICSWALWTRNSPETSLSPGSFLVKLNFIRNAQDSLEMDCAPLPCFTYKWQILRTPTDKQYLTTQESMSSKILEGEALSSPLSRPLILHLFFPYFAVGHVAISWGRVRTCTLVSQTLHATSSALGPLLQYLSLTGKILLLSHSLHLHLLRLEFAHSFGCQNLLPVSLLQWFSGCFDTCTLENRKTTTNLCLVMLWIRPLGKL